MKGISAKVNELVSVIVPVFNVEKFVGNCIDSILGQTYTNFELILIDDGSTDLSGVICDDYAKKDNRISVIHQKNKGLSETRNVGIRESKGAYIQFVDSDDWISKDALSSALRDIKKYDADILCFRALYVYADKIRHTKKVNYRVKVLNREEALSVLYFPQLVDVITWNKFMKREVLEGIIYPKGRLYEDMYTTYKIIANADRIVCVSDEYYYYRKNPESIGNRKFSSKTYELSNAAKECFDYCNLVPGTDKNALKVGLWKWQIVVANIMAKSNENDATYIKRTQKDIDILEVMQCRHLPIINKIQMLIFKYNYSVYQFLYMQYFSTRRM
ncbi:glycosyltransferase family 2 protein [Butyrivibrio sp. FCS006]|uniref:glycosyltransferase family 2 protein n=1 Tax=Butyrivibrio sp. FCS006 TaxID=1280684 RepID=UPI0006842B9C|nr:glycosyltransferase family 2 protein [Butyrivibrio sp. FCS006]